LTNVVHSLIIAVFYELSTNKLHKNVDFLQMYVITEVRFQKRGDDTNVRSNKTPERLHPAAFVPLESTAKRRDRINQKPYI